MLYSAIAFLVTAIVAGLLGFSGVGGPAATIAWIVSVVGLVLAVVFYVRSRASHQ